jgi:hypothetical protein
LIATSIVMKDPYNLPNADPGEREVIQNLRDNLQCSRTEIGPKGEFLVEYDLVISNPDWRKDV